MPRGIIHRSLAGVACAALISAAASGPALAQSYDIDPNATPGKARFMALAQAQFQRDHSTLFKTIKPKPEDQQAVFECGIKALLADMPEADAGRAADIIEGKSPPDAAIMKWFDFDPTTNPGRRQQVMTRANVICPQFSDIMK